MHVIARWMRGSGCKVFTNGGTGLGREEGRGAFITIDGEEVKAPIEHGHVILNRFVDRCQMRN